MTKGDRLRREIEILRAEAKARRMTAGYLVEAIDRLQRQIDELFPVQSAGVPVESAADQSPPPRAKKKTLKK